MTTTAWQIKQTDPNATLVATDSSVYYRDKAGSSYMYDPNYINANATLVEMRALLKTRADNQGPPPYANCP